MRFQAPQLGALGVTFTALRAAQFVSLITIIGLVANFVNEIVTAQRDAPDVFVGTLAVASTGALYIAITYILYYDGLLPLLVSAGLDLSLLIATIVVAVTIGRPLSMLTCEALPKSSSTPLAYASSASSYTPPTLGATVATTKDAIGARGIISKAVNYFAFVAIDQPHCYEIKAVWGLSIALCVLFAFSALVCVGLWRRIKTSATSFKDLEASG